MDVYEIDTELLFAVICLFLILIFIGIGIVWTNSGSFESKFQVCCIEGYEFYVGNKKMANKLDSEGKPVECKINKCVDIGG